MGTKNRTILRFQSKFRQKGTEGVERLSWQTLRIGDLGGRWGIGVLGVQTEYSAQVLDKNWVGATALISIAQMAIAFMAIAQMAIA